MTMILCGRRCSDGAREYREVRWGTTERQKSERRRIKKKKINVMKIRIRTRYIAYVSAPRKRRVGEDGYAWRPTSAMTNRAVRARRYEIYRSARGLYLWSPPVTITIVRYYYFRRRRAARSGGRPSRSSRRLFASAHAVPRLGGERGGSAARPLRIERPGLASPRRSPPAAAENVTLCLSLEREHPQGVHCTPPLGFFKM